MRKIKQWNSYRTNFQGVLENIKVEELSDIDYSKDTLEERKEFIENKIKEVNPFFETYFNGEEIETEEGEKKIREYFNFSPSLTDELSFDINICKFIEQYGSYLLNSKDIEKSRQLKYTILTEEEFKKYLKHEMSVDTSIILDTRPSNDYINLKLKITKKDIYPTSDNLREKEVELSSILKDYEKYRDALKEQMQRIKNGEETELGLYQIKKILGFIMCDMLDCKEQILGIRCAAKRLGDETPYNDFSVLNYKDPIHIKYMLKYCRLTNTPRPDNMSSHIGYDLNCAVKKLRKAKKLDKIDLEIIDCYNSGNYTQRQIAQEINRSKRVVAQRLDKICRRISKIMSY